MASLQTLTLAHLPPDLAVHLALYTDLQNASFLRDQLLKGNPDFEYALIDASVIISTTHALAAVFRAANDHLHGRLKSRNVHSEVVFALGTNNNIAHSLNAFGISPSTSSLLIIKLATNPSVTASTVSTHLATAVQGTAVSFDDDTMARIADIGRIRKVYKLGGVGGGGVGGEVDTKGKRRRRKDGSEEGSRGAGGGGAVVVVGGDGGKGGGGGGGGIGGLVGDGAEREREKEREREELEVAILGLMALRGAV